MATTRSAALLLALLVTGCEGSALNPTPSPRIKETSIGPWERLRTGPHGGADFFRRRVEGGYLYWSGDERAAFTFVPSPAVEAAAPTGGK